MNIINLVNEAIRDLDEAQKKASLIIQKCIRVASYLGDIYSVTLFRLNMRNFENKLESQEIQKEFQKYNLDRGKTANDIKEEWNVLISEFVELRTLHFSGGENDGKVVSLSVPEIENKIEELSISLERNNIPEGMHHQDIYFLRQSKVKVDQVLIDGISAYKAILERIKMKAYSYLVGIEVTLNNSIDNEKVGQEGTIVTNKNVFIIHGHNEAKWRELEKMLRNDFGLEPIVMGEKPDGGATTLIDKFEFYANQCSYAFALFTPDDIVENNGNKYFQARPNVIFELGWFVSRLGRRNVCLILQENQNMVQMFSDFQGVIQKRFQKNVSEIYRDIMLELRDVGMIE